MKILLINHYAGSHEHGMEYRHYYLAKEWLRLGFQVTVVAASYSHLRSNQPKIKESFTEENIEGINYIWLRTPVYSGNGIGRVINMLLFSYQLIHHKNRIIKLSQPDIVIASSPHPFIIFGANKIKKLTKAKLVFEVRDLWPISLVELANISTKHPFIQLMQYTENYAYHHADFVVSLLPKAKEYMQLHGLLPEKFRYIPNGIDTHSWDALIESLPKEYEEIINNLKKENQFVVGYTGEHGVPNALEYLLEAASLLKPYPIVFLLVGKGSLKKQLQQKAIKLKLTNVHFLSPVPKDTIPNLLSKMDALFIGWNRESLYRFGVSPNKLMDYMMSGKPVIHSIEAGNDLVAESGCGISVPPESP